MIAGSTFDIYLVGYSGFDGENGSGVGPMINISGVTFECLAATGLSAVPEPATFAALFVFMAIACAACRRHPRHRKNPSDRR